jgi:tetratricopeptide (TPR) repeat protein
VAAFNSAVDRASALARKRLDANARDVDAHYQLGAALGLRASYAATVDNSLRSSFSAARQAYQEHERVLDLDPRRKDAGLIVGTYRYVVSVLALPLRLAAYLAGFGGGKDEGVRMIEDAVAYGGDNQEDARFALVLLYNREHRYDDALKQLATLRSRYTRNRLVWVESGATSLRAGRPADAERFITEELARFASDTRPRMLGEDAIAFYKRGAARAALGRTADAAQDLRQSIGLEGRNWVHGRAHLELGKIALKAGNRAEAHKEFRDAARLCDLDNDAASAAQARTMDRNVG